MTENEAEPQPAVAADSVAARLRAAREAAGYDIGQVAAETRIPQRHLVAIEEGRFGDLPSRTYAVGFSRTFARTVGLDEKDIVAQVREELSQGQAVGTGPQRFEPGDPARVPGRALTWFALFAGVILIAGIFAFYRSYFAPGMGPAPLTAPQPKPTRSAERMPRPGATTAVANGPVTLTSEMDDTWVKIYEAEGGARIFEAQMAKGDSFTIPATAKAPLLWTGRPYALAITIGGKPVAKISAEDKIVKDVPLNAAALAARPVAPPQPRPLTTGPATPRPTSAATPPSAR